MMSLGVFPRHHHLKAIRHGLNSSVQPDEATSGIRTEIDNLRGSQQQRMDIAPPPQTSGGLGHGFAGLPISANAKSFEIRVEIIDLLSLRDGSGGHIGAPSSPNATSPSGTGASSNDGTALRYRTSRRHRNRLATYRIPVTEDPFPRPDQPGDLLTQPNWVWHDHNNKTADPMIWVDSLDAGVVRLLDARFYEKWPDGRVQPISKPDQYSIKRFGALGTIEETNWAVPYHYKWPETAAALQVLASDTDDRDEVILEYKNPVTGGHTLRNTTCCIQMLRPGECTPPRRSTGAIIYHVYQGTGSTRVGPGGGARTVLAWQEKDVFVVPSWEWRHHENTSSSPAYLFSVSDRPIVEAAGLWREELGGNR